MREDFSWIRRFVEGAATCEVRQVSKYFEQTKGCMARLGVPYSGGSPGRAVLEALKHLMKPPRQPVTEAHKRHLLSLQKNQCAVCSKSLSETAWECDHVPRRIESAETSVRILCLECHTQVTSEQQSVGNVWDFQSRFSPHAVEQFHNLPATPPLIFQHSDAPGVSGEISWQVDLARCRANCCVESSTDSWMSFSQVMH